jgi:hypothetical protein
VSLNSLLTGAAIIVVASSQPTQAAERLYVTYGPLGRSFSIEELRNFADTGETTRRLRWYLNLANVEPEKFRQILTKQVPLNLKLIDRITYSLPGEFALFQVGQVVHTKSRRANIQALRAALIISTTNDNKISILEFLENYPTQGMYIDGVVLARVVRDVKDVVDDIEPVVVAIEEFLANLICECDSNQTPTTVP